MRKRNAFLFIILLVLITAAAPGCDSLAVIPAGAYATPAQTASSGTPAPAAPTPAETAEPTTPPSATAEPTQEPTEAPTAEPTIEPTTEPTPEPQPEKMDLLFAGDITFQSSALKMQWDAVQGKYDFTSYFEGVAPVIQQADFAIGNLDAPVWDIKKSKLGETRFAAPSQAVDALKAAGFDVLTTANNQAMDQGAQALSNTIDVIRNAGLMPAGTWRSAEERDGICWLEKGGLKVALFASTYGVNKPVGDGETGVSLIDLKRMRADVQRARQAGADAVIFVLHFGTQYTHDADNNQKKVVKALKQAGADAVVGEHPRVLQPFETNPQSGFFAAYSLGSAVTNLPSRDRQFSALLKLTIARDASTGKAKVSGFSYIPTWSRALAAPGEKPKLRVLDLRQALQDCKSGANPLVPKKYLDEIMKGMKLVQDTLGGKNMEPLPK